MRKVLTSNITVGAAAKIKSGTLEHIQKAYTEMLKLLAQGLIGLNYDPNAANAPWVIVGCVNTGSGSNYIISEGLILYNGMLYRVPPATFTTSGGQVPIVTLTTAFITAANYDPVTFTGTAGTFNIHENKTFVITAGTTGTGTFDYSAVWFTDPSIEQALTLTGNYSVQVACAVRRNRDGMCSLSGELSCGAGATVGNTITTIPAGYRPRKQVYIIMPIAKAGVYQSIYLSISTAGLVVINDAGGTALNGYFLSLDSIPPFYTTP
jgi:hypothetical protein